ncbi:hypothetical protein [Ruegeria faecimaris]|uniref:Uncharacterized protein n=1 Tax=Ruegeria faecimaris TaxID=686389 RepID=A0A521BL22_9RHOB|nr:hypothetical protein [Ruegeria faecimaris]SMO47792.1 hypothetical protein SAMN06265380_101919 [Ruegeria faecimaris]
MKPEKGVFIGQRKDRMGARLLMMLTCIRLAEDFDTSYRVNWFPKGADAPELDQPQELFSQEWMDEHFLSTESFDALGENSLPIWSFQGDATPDRLISHLNSGRSVVVEEGFEVLAFQWEDIEQIRPRYREFIHKIGFTDEIRTIMEKADAKLSGKGVSAYHIRRGDILNGLPWKHTTWPAKIEPEELYAAHLGKNAGCAAIMFSDQPELVARFQVQFPHLMQMSDIADLSSLTRAQRDFLELYTMSRADQLIAPYVSAFSMAAARISGQQGKVFRDVLNEDEVKRANEQVIARLHRGPEEFLNLSEAAHIYAKASFYLHGLGAGDRAEEALELVQPLMDAGSDNAFLPLLQALNYFYLNRWAEALEMTEAAFENPHIWPEDFAVVTALQAAIFGGQKKRWKAAQVFSRAFWTKPMRPDVIIFGSRLLYREQIAQRAMPPMDWVMQKAIRRPWFNYNAHVAQRKVLGRPPCNFDLILLDWASLSVDQRARRLTSNRSRLQTLADGLESSTQLPEDVCISREDPRFEGVQSLLRLHLGDTSLAQSLDIARKVAKRLPDNPLYLKRLAELYEKDGDFVNGRLAMADALACDPGNPFLVFAMGQYLERNGAEEQGQNQIIQAGELDDNTAAIQGEAGRIYLQRGEKQNARVHLSKAHALCPTLKRYSNQLKRAGGK